MVLILVLGGMTWWQGDLVWQVLQAPGSGPAAEVSVAIDRSKPGRSVMAALGRSESLGVRASNFFFVREEGSLVASGTLFANEERRVQGDDALASSADGIFYHSYISFSGLMDPGATRWNTGIFVHSSRDAGRTWSKAVPVVDHLNTLEPFEDKPYLCVDRAPQSPRSGALYLCWTQFERYGSSDPACRSRIQFSASLDQGGNFSHPKTISDEAGDCRDGDDTAEGAVPCVGLQGEVFVVWSARNALWLDSSTDGGQNFGTDRRIADHVGGWDLPVPGLARHNGMPVTGADLSSAPDKGSWYVVWIDEKNGDPDVWLLASRDRGSSWEDRVRVNDDGPGNVQMFAWLAVDATDGSLVVLFLDRRLQQGSQTQAVLARSTNGGRSFNNQILPIPAFSFPARGFFGDYCGLDAYAGQVALAFPRVGESQVELIGAWLSFP